MSSLLFEAVTMADSDALLVGNISHKLLLCYFYEYLLLTGPNLPTF